MNDLLLSVKDLKIQLPAKTGMKTIVDGLSFTISKGATLGIVGESGSGKTMTALSLMGFIPFVDAKGKVEGQAIFHRIDGQQVDLYTLPVMDWTAYRGQEIGMIFQEPMTALNPVLSCGAQLLEALKGKASKQHRRELALHWLERVQLPEPGQIFNAYPHQLSGGQLQRVLIAMALAGRPRLLLADEPTTALDVTTQQEILYLLKDLQEELDLSILFISHDLGVIAELADAVLVLRDGQMMEQGEVRTVFQKPQHPYTKGLLACRPPLDHRPRRLPVLRDFLEPPQSKAEVMESARPPISTEALLKLKQLTVTYSGRGGGLWNSNAKVRAVDAVDLEIFAGESLGLVGESGSGKTTLGKAMLRLVPSEAGRLIFEGQDLFDLPAKAWRKMQSHFQMIFQDPYASLNPRKSVGEALMEPMQVHGLYGNRRQREAKAVELLELVRLEADHVRRLPKAFSGGQRQRICIARALALQPRFLICDECVSALDVSIQAEMLNLLADLRDQFQLTLLFISHDLSVVRFICDRIAVMRQGQIVEQGSGEEILGRPKHPYTQRLIDAIPKGL